MNKCNPCKHCRKNPCQKFGYLAKDKPVRCESIEPAVQCCPSSSSESCCCPSSSSSSSSSSSCPCPSTSSSSSSSSSACCPISSSSSSSSSCPISSSSSSSCPKCQCSSSSSSSSSSECVCCPESSSSSSSSSECEPKKCNYCPNNPCGDHSLSSILDSLDCSCIEHSSSSDSCNHYDKNDKHHDKKNGKYHKSKQFVITFGEGKKHYWNEYSTCSEAIYVNGKVGPIIHLYRGYKYVFKVEQDIPPGARPEHYFVLTKCPDGGRNDIIPGGFEPIAQGCGYLCVNERTPRFFYYQDTRHRYIGGLVLVHDHYPHEK